MIKIPVTTSMIHKIFLNQPLGLVNPLIRQMIDLQPYTTIASAMANPTLYTIVYNIPWATLWGNTVDNKIAYVGLQLAKIGHNDAHSNISHQIPFVSLALSAKSFVRSSQSLTLIVSRTAGNNNVAQYAMMMIAEMVVQTVWGILISAVDTLSNTVNNVMNTAVDKIITNGLYRWLDHNDHHKITGSTGSTHGASTLSTHAINDKIAKDIIVVMIKSDLIIIPIR